MECACVCWGVLDVWAGWHDVSFCVVGCCGCLGGPALSVLVCGGCLSVVDIWVGWHSFAACVWWGVWMLWIFGWAEMGWQGIFFSMTTRRPTLKLSVVF